MKEPISQRKVTTITKAKTLLLVTTPNNSTRYIYINYNTTEGPVVMKVSASADGAELFGTFTDAWNVPVLDIGPTGADQGKGGKYLLLPPGFKGEVPAGYIPVRSQTYNGYLIPRAITNSSSGADTHAAIGLVKQLKLYPLSQAANPPPTRYTDMTGKVFDGIVKFDESFYQSGQVDCRRLDGQAGDFRSTPSASIRFSNT